MSYKLHQINNGGQKIQAHSVYLDTIHLVMILTSIMQVTPDKVTLCYQAVKTEKWDTSIKEGYTEKSDISLLDKLN